MNGGRTRPAEPPQQGKARRRTLGLLGGTFDPIHYGHLDVADAARDALTLDELLFIPAHDPPHKPIDPHASSFHRFAMAALAIGERAGYRLSDTELRREGHSYTDDTLRALHDAGWLASQLFFILGADAFAEIATWHRYPSVLDAAHFVVVARPGTTIEAALQRTPELRSRAELATCGGQPQSAHNGTTGIFLVEAQTRDVSSTTIRQRLARQQPIDDLVPPAVARHIVAHHLYGAVGRLHGENADD
jgi:nicotinate-nucleotide adenylyltransferase